MPYTYNPLEEWQRFYAQQAVLTGRPPTGRMTRAAVEAGLREQYEAETRAGEREFAAREAERGRTFQAEQAALQRGWAGEEAAKQREQQMYQAIGTGIGALPTTLAATEYLTRGPGGEPGWITKGYRGIREAISPTQAAITTAPGVAIEAGVPTYTGVGAYEAGGGGMTAAGAGTTPYVTAGGWGAVGGYAGAELGERYAQGLPAAGGRAERRTGGGIVGGVIAGGAATSWSGPGMIVGGIVGGIIGYATK